MATILEFPLSKLTPAPNRWTAEKDLNAEIIELNDRRPSPLQRAREWQAMRLFNANLCFD